MNRHDNKNKMGLKQALDAIREGTLSAESMIEECFDRIEAREEMIGAWQHRLSREAYLAHYRQNREFYEQSLLKGLPVGIKDIIDTAEMPTEMGSPIHQGRRPVDDASCVELLRRAGAIVLGKTVTTEFAYFRPGKTANPCDPSRTPGGSSSGSAAAVADDMVPMALGSQTAASVIRPAAYCGTVGYVGSRGEFSLRGIQPLGQSLDSLGMFARRVEDIELLRTVLLRQSDTAPVQTILKPTKILLVSGPAIGETSSDMQAAMRRVQKMLTGQGVTVVEPGSEIGLADLVTHHSVVMAYEVSRNLVYESGRCEQLSEPLQTLIETGLAMPRTDYLNALQAAEAIRQKLLAEYPDVDAILAPAAPGVAPEGRDNTGAPHMSRPWQVMGLPVVTLPGLVDTDGLPLGIQLVGQARDDDRLLCMARWLESLLS
ncbi:amidase [Marinobacterium marinum]|uniref:Amidase n=1 Tax=Marinobacterium marinum TaxID=2756129 RepID=A0A7W1WV53_9GAMM|nr:amidase [Marinobacterium marinum]MBA4500830.1 amidase [Marinobacterium marinum]